jgi:steroid 5-alpha reductase family enzyme
MDKYIRIIFSIFVLAIVGLFVLRLGAGEWTPLNSMMLATSALCCLLVLPLFVYIFTYAYGLACLLNGVVLALWLATPPAFILGGLMALYGLRLLLFSWRRQNTSGYAHRMAIMKSADQELPMPIRGLLWLQCSFLYCFHLFAIYVAGQTSELTLAIATGAAIMAGGLLLEALADAQKQQAKALAPKEFVQTGLYQRWRHPNYCGEILVQLGLITAGVGAVQLVAGNVALYLAVIIAPLYIALLLYSECGRADRQQEQQYGEIPAFRHYLANSGSVLPRLW